MSNFDDNFVVPQVYLHINNGGIYLGIADNGEGPEIITKTNHFDETTHYSKWHTDKETLKLLGEMFIEASKKDFSNFLEPLRGITKN